jgi:hypothetical protein
MENKKFEIVWLAPESLTPYAKNAKVHTTEQVDKIAGQIAAFGFDQPIVVDEQRVIIKGHGRREAAIRLNLQAVPVIVTDLDEYQAMAARIGDNKVSEAPWDTAMLQFEFGTLEAQGIDIPSQTGFSPAEVEEMSKGWSSDLKTVDDVQAHSEGIMGIIKVSCPQPQREELKEFLKVQIAESGFEGVELE